jgi:hypothetical protein
MMCVSDIRLKQTVDVKRKTHDDNRESQKQSADFLSAMEGDYL